MKKIKWIILSMVMIMLLSVPAYAAEKDYSVDVKKDYSSAKVTVTLPADEMEYEVTVISPDKKKEYKGIYTDDNIIECTINDVLKAGNWTVRVERIDPINISGNDEELKTDESELTGINIKFEGSMEKIVDVTKDIVVATDIVGLKMYFRDDNFVAEWTDTTCGNVNIEITDEKTMETLDKQTVKGMNYELPLNTKVESIIVKIVPSTSAREDGAEKQFTYRFDNHPDATVEFENLEITSKDSINTHITLNQEYAVQLLGNDKEILKTEILKAGAYDFDLPTEVGDNNYTVYIIDKDGNMRSTAGYVEKDVVAPVLQLANEYTQINTQNESIVLEGKVEDYDTFAINQKDIEPEGDHTFKYDYALKEGLNVIEIKATDRAGNVSVYTATINRIIPVEKPIPWIKIIIICILVIMVGLYIFDAIRKHYGGNTKLTKKKGSNKKQKEDTDYDKKKKRNGLISDLIGLFTPLVVIYLLSQFVLSITLVQSASMEPTLMTGNTIIINKLAYIGGREIRRGDIVIFNSDEYNYIVGKRVIGLPGDEIKFQDGYVVINGQYADESEYIPSDVETNSPKVFTVPEGCYFMLGDNREGSNDSRYWQNPYIPREKIIGRFMGQFDFSIESDILHQL